MSGHIFYWIKFPFNIITFILGFLNFSLFNFLDLSIFVTSSCSKIYFESFCVNYFLFVLKANNTHRVSFWRSLSAFGISYAISSLVSISLIYGCMPSMAFIFLATATSGCPSSSLLRILAVSDFWMFLIAAVLATTEAASSLTFWTSRVFGSKF